MQLASRFIGLSLKARLFVCKGLLVISNTSKTSLAVLTQETKSKQCDVTCHFCIHEKAVEAKIIALEHNLQFQFQPKRCRIIPHLQYPFHSRLLIWRKIMFL
ncbi:hypothetical protein POM88_049995 [Heracleum sosnowskyi]|uniref:Uncharacterized protein n=1 Tax=Heracleum sosnowskyi TaxID=360622 RepID=A0AAD8GXY9_9APIA|nr:hypothetical protein POM88_049995 [Heracleum sosnowskyi]